MLRHLAFALYMFAACISIARAAADDEKPDMAELKADAAKRFPQPVRVGDLVGRQVLQPVEAQHVLGRVRSIGRDANGDVLMFMSLGGFLGYGTRDVAVPIEAVVLLGEHVAVLDLTPEQLRALPVAPTNAHPVSGDATIRIGLTRPFH